MGMITTDKLKKECSEFYKIGYKTGYMSLVMFLKDIMPSDEFKVYEEKIKHHFDRLPSLVGILKEFQDQFIKKLTEE